MKPIKAAISIWMEPCWIPWESGLKSTSIFSAPEGLTPADYMEKVCPMSYKEMADYTIRLFQLDEKRKI